MADMERSTLSNNNNNDLGLPSDYGCGRTPAKNSGNDAAHNDPCFVDDGDVLHDDVDPGFVDADDAVAPNTDLEDNDEDVLHAVAPNTDLEDNDDSGFLDDDDVHQVVPNSASLPQRAPEERGPQTRLVDEHQTELLDLIREHRIEINGQETLTTEGWKIAENYLNPLRKTLSFLRTADIEDIGVATECQFFVYLVEEIYDQNEAGKTRIPQSFAKFSLDKPFTSMVRNLSGVYVNCEDITAKSIHGAGKRSALLFLTKVLKADIITILETRGCNWKNPMFKDIINGYVPVREYHSRGIAMLIRAEIKHSITIHSGYDGGCKHKESKIKTGDHEFICIDVMVQGLTYRMLYFYHASKKTVECIENFRTLIEVAIRDALVDSLAVMGDMNIRPGDKLSSNTGLPTGSYTEILDGVFRSNYNLHRVLPSNSPTYESFNSTNEKATLTQPDLILSRPGRGEQLFHKPIHLFSMVKGFLDMDPEVDLYMSREEHAALRAEITKIFEPKPTWSSTDCLDTYQGQGNGHYVFLYELGMNVGQPYPFPTIFQRTVTTEGPADVKKPEQECSSLSPKADEVKKADDPVQKRRVCEKKCILEEKFPYIGKISEAAFSSQDSAGSPHPSFCCQIP